VVEFGGEDLRVLVVREAVLGVEPLVELAPLLVDLVLAGRVAARPRFGVGPDRAVFREDRLPQAHFD